MGSGVSLGVLLALVLLLVLYLLRQDITQKKHAILRNYPLIGHLRYFFEQLGEYFRQYFFLGDRDECPSTGRPAAGSTGWPRTRAACIGFGSTYNLHESGALIFRQCAFPVLDETACRRRRWPSARAIAQSHSWPSPSSTSAA
jgi:hypothetical protein